MNGGAAVDVLGTNSGAQSKFFCRRLCKKEPWAKLEKRISSGASREEANAVQHSSCPRLK